MHPRTLAQVAPERVCKKVQAAIRRRPNRGHLEAQCREIQVQCVVSADGKTLSVHNTGVQLSGAVGDETLVFDKQ
jgi:hypothetical protein